MNREEAESERDRMAAEHPEATWLVAEREPGEWAVVKVGLAPVDGPDGTATQARPRPESAEDPRTSHRQNPYGNF
jgi:hypothetical protein